jgi:hypothetical protein
MTKDEALNLAMEALTRWAPPFYAGKDARMAEQTITAIKQAIAAPVQEPVKDNSNYRLDPPGLDPAGETQVSKVWWDGEKLMAKPIPLVDFYRPVQDSTCSETLRAQGKAYPRTCRKCGKGPCIGAPKQLPAQPASVQEPVVGCTHPNLGCCSLRDDGSPARWGCVMCGKEFVPKPAAQRPWVGLTDEEIKSLNLESYMEVFKIAMAKLKEKNNG